MGEITRSQLPVGSPLIGGTGIWESDYWPTIKSEAGTLLLPTAAARRGSLSLEGRNPYDAPVKSIGGFFQGRYWPGTYEVYRIMECYPTIALAKATVIGPILAAGWTIKKTDDAPEEAEELIENTLIKMRIDILRGMLRALTYGNKCHEVVWGDGLGETQGYRIPLRIKGLRNEWTFFRTDKNGNVLGVDNTGVFVPNSRLLYYSYDSEDGNPYGRARNENCRRHWCNALATEDQLQRLQGKAAGILAKVGYPPDVGAPAVGERMFDKAVDVARDITNGKTIVYPIMPGFNPEDLSEAVDAAKLDLFPIELLQMGETGQAQLAMLERLMYLDKMLCRGWLRSERSAIEAQGGGTKAESSDHTANISDTDCDHIHGEVTKAVNEQLLNPMIAENFGDEAVGTIELVPNEMVDEHMVVDMKLLDNSLRDANSLREFFSRVDWAGFCQRNNIPIRKDAESWSEVETPDEARQREADAAMQQAQASGFTKNAKDPRTNGERNDKSDKPNPMNGNNTQYEKERDKTKAKQIKKPS